jgi:hypothetical protein
VRVRLWGDNTGQGLPKEPRTELVSLEVDGKPAEPRAVSTKDDRYFIHQVSTPGSHHAVARVKILSNGAVKVLEKRWTS